ncbi:MAG: RNA methyltransferase [Bdellovibrionales bacterium]|nr:RNA methyltransferase [Bdellovibrionales bacterium]
MRKQSSEQLRWVVGDHACAEALRVFPQDVREVCFINTDQAEKAPWSDLLKKFKGKPQARGAKFFNSLTDFGHQGVAVSVAATPEWNTEREGTSSFVLLDGVEDPHNLGAIIRTSWLMGVNGVGITEHRSTKVTPAASKVASGGCEHVPVQEIHFVNFLEDVKKQGYWVYGFSEKGTKTLYQTEFAEKSIFVFGSEEKGIRSTVLSACDEVLSIPQTSADASYNVSVSVGVALGEFQRQQRWSKKSK